MTGPMLKIDIMKMPCFNTIPVLQTVMKHKSAWVLFLLCLACSPRNPGVSPEGADMKTATLPEWFSGGKFGMFIHWGPYSVLGGEWNGQRIEPGDIAEWIMQRFRDTRGRIPQGRRLFRSGPVRCARMGGPGQEGRHDLSHHHREAP